LVLCIKGVVSELLLEKTQRL